jgi:hypothetical protein
MKTQVRKPAEIQSAAIFRSTARRSFTEKGITITAGEVFYRVNSDTVADSYIVRWNDASLAWECNCPSVKSCKHCRAIAEVCKERVQYQPEAILARHASTFNHDPLRFLTAAQATKAAGLPAPYDEPPMIIGGVSYYTAEQMRQLEVTPAASSLAHRTGQVSITAALTEMYVSMQDGIHAALDAAYDARAEEMALQAAWEEFMSVPSYISRFKEGRESFEDEPVYCQSCGKLSRSGYCYRCYGA